MKHYYSVEAYSQHEIAFPEHLVALGKGVNVFTLTTEDIQGELVKFAQAGVRIDKVHALDGMASFHGLPGTALPILG